MVEALDPDDDKPTLADGRMTQTLTEPRKTALVVLGMHRSGTSAMSRVLSLSGAALPEKVMPAGQGNLLGHWEAQDIADINDRILADLDSAWDDTFGPRRNGKAKIPTVKYLEAAKTAIRENWPNQPIIVVKEPRVTLVLELWAQALIEEGYRPVYVIMTRHPIEVAASLKSRNGLPRNQSLILWAKYMLAAEVGTRGAPRLFVRYEDLLDAPEDVLDRMETSLDVILPRRSWLAATEIDRFLTTDARHHDAKGKTVARTLPAIQDYFNYLEGAALGAVANEDASAALQEWLGALEQTVGPILASLESNLRETQHALRAKDNLLAEINERLSTNEAAFTERERQLIAELEDSNATIVAFRAEFEQENTRIRAAIDATKAESQLHQINAETHAEATLQVRGELERALLRHRELEEARDRERLELNGALTEARRALDEQIREIEAERALERHQFSREREETQARIEAFTLADREARQALEIRLWEIEAESDRDRRRLASDLLEAQAVISALTQSETERRRALEDQIREIETARDQDRRRFVSDAAEARAQFSAYTRSAAEQRRTLQERIREIQAERDADCGRLTADLGAARAEIRALEQAELERRNILDEKAHALEDKLNEERECFSTELRAAHAQLTTALGLHAEGQRALEQSIREIEAERDLDRDHYAISLVELRSALAALTLSDSQKCHDLADRLRQIESEYDSFQTSLENIFPLSKSDASFPGLDRIGRSLWLTEHISVLNNTNQALGEHISKQSVQNASLTDELSHNTNLVKIANKDLSFQANEINQLRRSIMAWRHSSRQYSVEIEELRRDLAQQRDLSAAFSRAISEIVSGRNNLRGVSLATLLRAVWSRITGRKT